MKGEKGVFKKFREGTAGLVLSAVLLWGMGFSNAGSLYKWVDEDGNVTYQDTPPPSNVNFEEQTYTDPDAAIQEALSLSIETAAEENPISLYSIPNCDTCDLVRLYLDKYAIPFAEKDIQSNLVLQQELESKAGQLSVPTLIIGDELIDGYSKSALRKVLLDSGYPIDQLEAGVSEAEFPLDENETEADSEEELSESEFSEDQITLDGNVDTDNDLEPETSSENQMGTN